MHEGLQARRKSDGLEMDSKQMDGLQNFVKALIVAKHKDLSGHGMYEHRCHNEILQAAQGIPLHSPSATIHCRSPSTNHTQLRYSTPQVFSCIRFDSTLRRYHRPAQPKTEAKVVEHSKMDTKALIAAALAPVAGFPNLGQIFQSAYSSKPPAITNDPTQEVSPNAVVFSI
jgi:hypothetical protein